MSRNQYKTFLVVIWVAVMYGYLYLMQLVYDAEKSFHLFLLLALAGTLAGDGLKTILRYEAFYPSDIRRVSGYVMGFLASLSSSVASPFIAAELYHYGFLSQTTSKIVAGVGFLASIAAGMWLLANAERHFRLSNRA